ncbi:MAG: hypothetical protein B0A82_19235 [Alkalinema sp. CACIAM 70d]|nr:MAG: hypothetical protein B0A82_19235 [Alkalinema sp. CACIAM 70d]
MQLGDTQVSRVQRGGVQLNAGTTLQNGKYLLNHSWDGQGIGLTYRATVSATGQTVAIKTFNPTLQAHPKFAQLRQRFLDRSRLLAASQHPSLVRVLDVFSEADQPFVVMEYISGSTLADLLASRAALSPKAVLQALCQATAALRVAHHHHLVHGNLHPRQLIQRPGSNGFVLVGFSTGLIPAASKSMDPARSLYWAPEMLTQGATPQTDLYSIAAMLYHGLSNHPPLSVASGDLTEKFPLLPLLPPAVQKVLRYAMATDPKQRVQTAEALFHLLGGESAASSQMDQSDRPQPSTAPSLTTPTLAPSPLATSPSAPMMAVTVAPAEPTLVPSVPSSEAMLMGSDQPEVTASASPTVTPSNASIVLPRLPQTPPTAEPIALAQPLASSDAPAPSPLAPAPYRHEPLAEPDPTSGSLSLDAASPESAPDLDYSSKASQSSTPNSSMLIVPKYPKRAFVLIGTIAATLGLGFGLALRFSAGQRPGSSLFHAGQSFPQREWKGSVEAVENSDDIPSEAPGSKSGSANSGSTSPTNEVNTFPEPIESPLPRREIPLNPEPAVDPIAPTSSEEPSSPPVASPSRRASEAPPAPSRSTPPAKAPLVEPELPPPASAPASSKSPRESDPAPPSASPKAFTKSADPLPAEPTSKGTSSNEGFR